MSFSEGEMFLVHRTQRVLIEQRFSNSAHCQVMTNDSLVT